MLLFLHIFTGCSSQEKKESFIGKYHINKTVPADTTAETQGRIRQTSDWKISLEEDNNFELTGTGKHIVGYWEVQKLNDKEYKLLLQGGGSTIYARFDGTSIYFDKRYRMFDELFSEISFTKK